MAVDPGPDNSGEGIAGSVAKTCPARQLLRLAVGWVRMSGFKWRHFCGEVILWAVRGTAATA
jgi:hypothetical protein